MQLRLHFYFGRTLTARGRIFVLPLSAAAFLFYYLGRRISRILHFTQILPILPNYGSRAVYLREKHITHQSNCQFYAS